MFACRRVTPIRMPEVPAPRSPAPPPPPPLPPAPLPPQEIVLKGRGSFPPFFSPEAPAVLAERVVPIPRPARPLGGYCFSNPPLYRYRPARLPTTGPGFGRTGLCPSRSVGRPAFFSYVHPPRPPKRDRFDRPPGVPSAARCPKPGCPPLAYGNALPSKVKNRVPRPRPPPPRFVADDETRPKGRLPAPLGFLARWSSAAAQPGRSNNPGRLTKARKKDAAEFCAWCRPPNLSSSDRSPLTPVCPRRHFRPLPAPIPPDPPWPVPETQSTGEPPRGVAVPVQAAASASLGTGTPPIPGPESRRPAPRVETPPSRPAPPPEIQTSVSGGGGQTTGPPFPFGDEPRTPPARFTPPSRGPRSESTQYLLPAMTSRSRLAPSKSPRPRLLPPGHPTSSPIAQAPTRDSSVQKKRKGTSAQLVAAPPPVPAAVRRTLTACAAGPLGCPRLFARCSRPYHLGSKPCFR